MSRPRLSTFRRFRPLIVVTAELTGVLTLVGTLASVWFNSIRFRAWGLDFLDIATPGDILMSGLEVAATASRFVLAAFALAVVTIIPVLAFRLVPVSDRNRRIILFFGFLVCTGVVSALLINASFMPAFLGMVATGGITAYFILHAGKLGERPVLNLPLLAVLAAALIYLVVASIERQARYGAHDDQFAVAVEDRDDLCKGLMRARWIGTQSVIVSCQAHAGESPMVRDRASVAIADEESAKDILQRRLAATVGERPGPGFAWTDLGTFETQHYGSERINLVEARDFIASDFREHRGNIRRVWMAREYAAPWSDGTVRETVLVEADCHDGTATVVDFTDVTADGQIRRRDVDRPRNDRRRTFSTSTALETLHFDLICRSWDAGPASHATSRAEAPSPSATPPS